MTKIYLMKNSLFNSDYEHTLTFESLQEQKNYFLNNFENIDFIIKNFKVDNYLRLPIANDTIKEYNYFMVVQKNKHYFGFIKSTEYHNANLSQINYDIDVMQTYFAVDNQGVKIKSAFVEREHQDRFELENGILKPIYNNEIENIDLGQSYVIDETENLKPDIAGVKDLTYLLVCCKKNSFKRKDSESYINTTTIVFEGDDRSTYETNFNWLVVPFINVTDEEIDNNNLVNPYRFITRKTQTTTNNYNIEKIERLNYLSNIISNSDKVVGMYILKNPPFEIVVDSEKKIYDSTQPNNAVGYRNLIYLLTEKSDVDANVWSSFYFIEKLFIPKNQLYKKIDLKKYYQQTENIINLVETNENILSETKLNLAPYKFLRFEYVDKNIDFKMQNYDDDFIDINCYQSFDFNFSTLFELVNYKDIDNKIISTQPNKISLTSDKWLDYLQQNKNSRESGYITQGVQTAVAVGGIIAGVASGGIGLAVAGGVGLAMNTFSNISSQMAKEKDLQEQPNETRFVAGDSALNYYLSDLKPTLKVYSVSDKIKQKLWNYFLRYGYKVNDFKTPNIKSRRRYNFIKANVDMWEYNDYIPNNDLSNIKNVLAKGITFWHINEETKNTNIYELFDYYKNNCEKSLLI